MILRLVEGLTGPEIAEQTGLSPGSVRVNLHRGMKLLRERLGIASSDEEASEPLTKPDDYLWDGSGDADPDVAKLEQLLRPLAHDRPLDELRMQRAKRRKAPWIMAGIAAIAAAAVLVLVLRRGETPEAVDCAVAGEGFAFRASGDGVSCSGSSSPAGVLRSAACSTPGLRT